MTGPKNAKKQPTGAAPQFALAIGLVVVLLVLVVGLLIRPEAAERALPTVSGLVGTCLGYVFGCR